MTTALHRQEQRLDDLGFRLESAMSERLRQGRRHISELDAAVLRHDPRRQFSAARETLAVSQSRLHHALERGLVAAGHRNRNLEDRLYRAVQVSIAEQRSAFVNLRGQLQSLSPLAVLQRGYAIVQDEAGAVVRSVNQIAAGQLLQTRVGDGEFSSNVKAITPTKKKKGRVTNS